MATQDSPDFTKLQAAAGLYTPLTPGAVVAAGTNSASAAIGQFNSFVVTLGPPSVGFDACAVVVQLNASGVIVRVDRVSYAAPLGTRPYSVTIPAVGVSAFVVNSSVTSTMTVSIQGSTLAVTRPIQGNFMGARRYTFTGSFLAGGIQLMTAVGGVGNEGQGYCCDYPVALSLTATAAPASPNPVIAGFRYMAVAGTTEDVVDPQLLDNIPVTHAGIASWAVDQQGFAIPLGTACPILWNTGNVGAASATYTLDIIPRVA